MKTTDNNISQILDVLGKQIKKSDQGAVISFEEFLQIAGEKPYLVFRNIFQLFHDMVYYYTVHDEDDNDDPHYINYKTIDSTNLLVSDTDTPFFADLPLLNRLIKFVDAFKKGVQQNKIYVFVGPHGSGKSTLLNNILRKLEEYTRLPEGLTYELFWNIETSTLYPDLSAEVKEALDEFFKKNKKITVNTKPATLEISCPSHDHPFLIIPRGLRREVLEKLLSGETKIKIFNKKEYEWIFKNDACTICTSIYNAYAKKLSSPTDIFKMVSARRYRFNRRLGTGITVYNPGDQDPAKFVYSNKEVQTEIDHIFKDSQKIKYIYSKYANTNNGVYVLMDVKGYNEKRFLDLHGIISEGTHKVEDVEENVNSLFLAVMNPEDKKVANRESFKDRIKEINVNYVLNYDEEINIYCNAFGNQIKKRFLPRVLNNFAKIIISSRLNTRSEALKEWITDTKQYEKYCDENLLLLKLSIYNNKVPSYLSDEDKNRFSRKIRKQLINESEFEGRDGFSGRESLNIFNDFYNITRLKYEESGGSKRNILITMNDIKDYFQKHEAYAKKIPSGFLDAIIDLYDYNIMQQIKKSLFHQNEERISKDIQNYLFASNYDMGEAITSSFTNERIEITDTFLLGIENFLFAKNISEQSRKEKREDIASRFTINLQDMQISDSEITTTLIYKELYNTYIKNLRENIFQPFIQFASYEKAIVVYGTKKFEVFDDKTKEQVGYLIKNLIRKYQYTEDGAKQVCLYVLQNKIGEKFNA